jgi:Fic family protein
MGKVSKRTWKASGQAGLPRRDRKSCVYHTYIPDPLVGRTIRLDGEVAADVGEAEAAVTKLNAGARTLCDSEALARLLLRSESVASSKIEGLEIGARRLLRAEAARGLGEGPADVTANEVLGSIDAMAGALEGLEEGASITVDLVLDAHRRLLDGTPLAEQGGQVRKEQNWIGGSAFNPCSAAFVPPPWELVQDYLVDLVEFCNQDSLPPVAQAAVAHAQFETIHPFVDGNGRTGRVLTQLILRRRGVAPRVLPPVSLVLATWSTEYVSALTATRYIGSADSPEAQASLDRWIGLFAAATKRAVDDAAVFEERVGILQEDWRKRLGRVRADSATDLLIRALPGIPIFTVQSAAHVVGRSIPAVNQAIARMVEAKVIFQSTIGRRNRTFEAPELMQAFTDLERRLASPAGDTRSSPPARRVPPRSPRSG